MQQPQAPSPSDRRQHARAPRAFAFWIRAHVNGGRTSAWMLNTSVGGAAFMTAARDAPAVGTQIELREMLCHDRLVREDAGTLPHLARVLRHDETNELTCRVAVQFEEHDRSRCDDSAMRHERTSCPFTRVGNAPPPLPLTGPGPAIAVPHRPAG